MAERVIDIIEFARGVMGIELTKSQEEVLRQVERGEKLILMRRGKKTMVARVWDEYSRRGILPIVRARDKIEGD